MNVGREAGWAVSDTDMTFLTRDPADQAPQRFGCRRFRQCPSYTCLVEGASRGRRIRARARARSELKIVRRSASPMTVLGRGLSWSVGPLWIGFAQLACSSAALPRAHAMEHSVRVRGAVHGPAQVPDRHREDLASGQGFRSAGHALGRADISPVGASQAGRRLAPGPMQPRVDASSAVAPFGRCVRATRTAAQPPPAPRSRRRSPTVAQGRWCARRGRGLPIQAPPAAAEAAQSRCPFWVRRSRTAIRVDFVFDPVREIGGQDNDLADVPIESRKAARRGVRTIEAVNVGEPEAGVFRVTANNYPVPRLAHPSNHPSPKTGAS